MERLKKILTTSFLIVLSLCLTFVFTACDKKNNTDNTQIEETNNNDNNTNNGSGDNSNENTNNGNTNNNEQKAQLTKEYVSEMLQNSYYNSKAIDFEVEVKGQPTLLLTGAWFTESTSSIGMGQAFYYDEENNMYRGYITIYDGGYIYNDDFTIDEEVDIEIQISIEEVNNQPTQVVSCVLNSNIEATENVHIVLDDFQIVSYVLDSNIEATENVHIVSTDFNDFINSFLETENINIFNNNNELLTNCDYIIDSLAGYSYPEKEYDTNTIIKGSVNFYNSTPTLHLYIATEKIVYNKYKIETKNSIDRYYECYSFALKDKILRYVLFENTYEDEQNNYESIEEFLADLENNASVLRSLAVEDFIDNAKEDIPPYFYIIMQMVQSLTQTENNVFTLDTLSTLLTNNLNKFYDIKVEDSNITLDATLDLVPLCDTLVKCMQDNDNCLVAFNKIAHVLGYESTTFVDDVLEVIEKMLYIKDEFGSVTSTTVKNVLDELDAYLLKNGYTFTTQSILSIVEAMGFELPFEDTTTIEELYNTYSALLMEEETDFSLNYAGLIDAVKTKLESTNCRYVLTNNYDEEDPEPFNPGTEWYKLKFENHIELEDTKMKNITLTYEESVVLDDIFDNPLNSSTVVKFSTRDSDTVSDEILQKIMNNYYYNKLIAPKPQEDVVGDIADDVTVELDYPNSTGNIILDCSDEVLMPGDEIDNIRIENNTYYDLLLRVKVQTENEDIQLLKPQVNFVYFEQDGYYYFIGAIDWDYKLKLYYDTDVENNNISAIDNIIVTYETIAVPNNFVKNVLYDVWGNVPQELIDFIEE